jgi:carbonic anhydrase
MSCPNATAPVNIDKNTNNICDLKCKYNYNYPFTNLLVRNKGEYLSLKPDPEQVPSVTFNANNYNVSEIRIYKPSLHSFNGKKTDGELIINHTNVTGVGDLLVCIPLEKANIINTSTGLLDPIISGVAQRAPSMGGSTNINLPTFSLNKFISQKIPFYSYTGTLPYTPCNGVYNYVVFGTNASVAVGGNAWSSLDKILITNNIEVKNNDNIEIFYNKNGATKGGGIGSGGDDDIYIECNPTGDEGEILVDKSNVFDDLLNDPNSIINKGKSLINILLGAIIIYVLMKVIRTLLNKISEGGKFNFMQGIEDSLQGQGDIET